MATVNIHAAKTHLSRFADSDEGGRLIQSMAAGFRWSRPGVSVVGDMIKSGGGVLVKRG